MGKYSFPFFLFTSWLLLTFFSFPVQQHCFYQHISPGSQIFFLMYLFIFYFNYIVFNFNQMKCRLSVQTMKFVAKYWNYKLLLKKGILNYKRNIFRTSLYSLENHWCLHLYGSCLFWFNLNYTLPSFCDVAPFLENCVFWGLGVFSWHFALVFSKNEITSKILDNILLGVNILRVNII